ncbi:Uncharacterised protein [Yersinia frederiksenii]|nr:Uncharacterised protein [Yersinia frederiksenii]
MDTTTSREDFEAEFRKQRAGQLHIEMLLEMYNHGTEEEPEIDYYSLDARDAWKWWQASRASIAVELPKHCERYVWSDGAFNFKEDITEVLRSAGLTVKGD